MAYPNKEYHYHQSSIPASQGVAGSGILFLDACLVNGFNIKTVTSISVTANIATLSFTATTQSITVTNFIGNNTTTVTCTFVGGTIGLYAGDVITISGASGTEQTKLNGTWLILAVPTATTFTFIVDSNVASGTLSTNLGTSIKTNTGFQIDEIILISGANESIFNGEFKILSVLSDTSFTFTLTTALSAATGTISVKIAPLGWEKAYSGTNKAVYRSLDSTSTKLYLRVDDTNAQYMLVNMYETMTSVDDGTGVSSNIYWGRGNSSTSIFRPFYLIGNSKIFYLFIDIDHISNLNNPNGFVFGDFISLNPQDKYNCLLIGQTTLNLTSPSSSNNFINFGTSFNVGQYIARSYTQFGLAINFYKLSSSSTPIFGYNGVCVYPNPVDNGIHFTPVYIHETTTGVFRGIMPGIYAPFENTLGNIFSRDKTIKPNNKTFIAYKICASSNNVPRGNCFFNLDDEWV